MKELLKISLPQLEVDHRSSIPSSEESVDTFSVNKE